MSNPWQRLPDSSGQRPRSGWPRWLIVLIVIAMAALGLSLLFPDALSGEDRWPRMLYLVALLALVGSSYSLRRLFSSRRGLVELVRNAGIWIAIALALMVAYSFRHEAGMAWRRVAGELMPGSGIAHGPSEMRFAAAQDGHFHIQAEVGGAVIEFLLDTGASEIILTQEDARRIGYDPAALSYTVPFNTANGTIRAARIRLKRLAVGEIEFRDVVAYVNGGALDRSLLGVSFLERLSSYEVQGGTLILRR